MFIHCPHCQSLVTTDPATGEPPERCPRCSKPLAEPAGRAVDPAGDDAGTGQAGANPPLQKQPAAEPAEQADPAGEATPSHRDRPPSNDDDAPAAPPSDTPPDTDNGEAAAPGVVDASANTPQPAPADEADAGHDEATQATADAASAGALPADQSHDGEAIEAAPASTAITTPSPAAEPGETAPGFARVRVRAPAPAFAGSGRKRWLPPALIAGLGLLLALQWVLADRQRLAADARWRPFVVQLCGVLRCKVPPWREPAAFVLLDRDVRPHPELPGVLRVSATFRNTAHWAQPWPEVVLTLSDVEGSTVGARAFTAAQYLGNTPTRETLASGQAATIRLDVIEPLPRSVAFAFDFR